MPFLDELITRDIGDGNAELVKRFRYKCPDTVEIIEARKGFVTDFASIPRIFRVLITGNDNTKKPAVIHDKLYRDRVGERPRKRVDQIFLMGMKESGVPWWKRYMAYYGVRIGGWASWVKKNELML